MHERLRPSMLRGPVDLVLFKRLAASCFALTGRLVVVSDIVVTSGALPSRSCAGRLPRSRDTMQHKLEKVSCIDNKRHFCKIFMARRREKRGGIHRGSGRLPHEWRSREGRRLAHQPEAPEKVTAATLSLALRAGVDRTATEHSALVRRGSPDPAAARTVGLPSLCGTPGETCRSREWQGQETIATTRNPRFGSARAPRSARVSGPLLLTSSVVA
jgi:hypothetical protein